MKWLVIIVVSLMCFSNSNIVYAQVEDPYKSEFLKNGGVIRPMVFMYVNDYVKNSFRGHSFSDMTRFIKYNKDMGFGKNGNYRFYDVIYRYDKSGYYSGKILYSVRWDDLFCYLSTYVGDGRVIEDYSKKIVDIKKDYYSNMVLETTVNYFKGQFHGEFVVLNQDSLPLYQTTFKHGKGYWKDYYYLRKTNTYQLKEEGAVEHSYKVGTWKYYTEDGILELEKIYQIKDSVDVRFPHCLFNKTEPCMEKESDAERLRYPNESYRE